MSAAVVLALRVKFYLAHVSPSIVHHLCDGLNEFFTKVGLQQEVMSEDDINAAYQTAMKVQNSAFESTARTPK